MNEPLFANLCQAQVLIGTWRDDHKRNRPYMSLGGLSPWGHHRRSIEDLSLSRAN